MKKATQQLRKKYNKIVQKSQPIIIFMSGLVIIASLVLGLGFGVYAYYQDRILPNISVAGYDVGNMKIDEATFALSQLSDDYRNRQKLQIIPPDQSATNSATTPLEIPLEELNLNYDVEATIKEVSQKNRGETPTEFFKNLFLSRNQKTHVPYSLSYDSPALKEFLQPIMDEYEQPGAKPEIQIVNTNPISFEVFEGTDGYEVNYDNLVERITSKWKLLSSSEVRLELKYQDNQLSEEQLEQAKLRAETLAQSSLTMEIYPEDQENNESWSLDANEIVSFIDPNGGFDREQINNYVSTLAESINRAPQNATFDFEEGRVTNFVPSRPGIVFPVGVNTTRIIERLTQLETQPQTQAYEEVSQVESEPETLVLAFEESEPEITTADVNDLGIKELIGEGYSTFRGSIPGRVHNVALTAERINGTLVPPGEEFSFNQTVGEISRATGYQTAYVISGGRTVLGDGGGVCQDSTTVFRAILDAGLPVTAWKAHSYRVGYYEQNEKPGFDATIYSPTVDLKFLNDTPAHILIQAQADTVNKTLSIKFYGTDDGREAEITNYQQWDAIPAPPPLYQDDPTLEPGQVKQIDWATPGLKVSYDYTVRRDGETIYEKSFYANFRAWQAVYLRGV